jgi:hypothetical protein
VAPLGLLIAGPVADWLGIQFWFITAGIACTIMGIILFGIPAVMNIEEGNKDVSRGSSGDQVFAEGGYNS